MCIRDSLKAEAALQTEQATAEGEASVPSEGEEEGPEVIILPKKEDAEKEDEIAVQESATE